MFDVCFFFGYNTDGKDCRLIAHHIPDLTRARHAREISGDIVVWSGSGDVVEHDAWLFDWEKKDPNCFARKMIDKAKNRRILAGE